MRAKFLEYDCQSINQFPGCICLTIVALLRAILKIDIRARQSLIGQGGTIARWQFRSQTIDRFDIIPSFRSDFIFQSSHRSHFFFGSSYRAEIFFGSSNRALTCAKANVV